MPWTNFLLLIVQLAILGVLSWLPLTIAVYLSRWIIRTAEAKSTEPPARRSGNTVSTRGSRR